VKGNESIGDCMCETVKGIYESLRKDYRNMHECCYQEYVRCVETGMKNDPKKCVGYLQPFCTFFW
jgi:hypothetical protein